MTLSPIQATTLALAFATFLALITLTMFSKTSRKLSLPALTWVLSIVIRYSLYYLAIKDGLSYFEMHIFADWSSAISIHGLVLFLVISIVELRDIACVMQKRNKFWEVVAWMLRCKSS